jgi:hypothetical protein
MLTDFYLWVFYKERRKNKNNMEIAEIKFIRICLKKYLHREKKE